MATDLLSADLTTTRSVSIGGREPVDVHSGIQRAGQGREVVSDRTQAKESSETTASRSKVLRDYFELTKPRIVMMILVTTSATAMIGAGGTFPIVDWFWLLLGTAAIAGSAGAANQIWERVIDCEMTRTANRPLPGGRVGVIPATAFTALVGVVGALVLWSKFGIAPAMSGIATWLIYVLVYTPLKTRTAWNTTVGAIAGALPVMIGYTATGGSIFDASGWLLFGVLATWQYPHFMSIAWMYRRQYDEAGFKMTTTVEPTGRSAGWQSIVGSLCLMLCGVAMCFVNEFSWFAIPAALCVVLATFPMLKASIGFSSAPNDKSARKLLRSSLLVLPAVLLVVTLRVFW